MATARAAKRKPREMASRLQAKFCSERFHQDAEVIYNERAGAEPEFERSCVMVPVIEWVTLTAGILAK